VYLNALSLEDKLILFVGPCKDDMPICKKPNKHKNKTKQKNNTLRSHCLIAEDLSFLGIEKNTSK